MPNQVGIVQRLSYLLAPELVTSTGVGGCSGTAEDGLNRSVHVGLVGRPVRHRDAHRCLAVPGRAAHPAGALPLHPLDHPAGVSVVVAVGGVEADEHLVEDHIVVVSYTHLRAHETDSYL